MSEAPLWLEVMVAALLVVSGIFVLISAVGFLFLPDFFLRLHAPALAYTGGSWTVALASVLYFSVLEFRAALHPVLVVVLLLITVPVTTLMLARVALFRRRVAEAPDTPPSLSPPPAQSVAGRNDEDVARGGTQ